MANKKLEFPNSDLKNHFYPQFVENRYKVILSTPSDNFISISDDYSGQGLYYDTFDKNSSIDYGKIVAP